MESEELNLDDALTMFSFEEIRSEITLRKSRSKTDIESWDLLYTVASELAGAPNTEASWLPHGKTWGLENVSIHDYRGVLNDAPLELSFDPTPGITVLHGLNGAGKSSISDAVEIGLSGKFLPVSSGAGGKAQLWDPIHLARGALRAVIRVTLSSGDERLILTTKLDSSGAIESHEAELDSGGSTTEVSLDSAWHDALHSHQPVFAYASLERRVQLSKDLANYFEGLLALGGSFTALEETIASRGKVSSQAFDRWRAARKLAMSALERVDDERVTDVALDPLKPVREPSIDDELDEWLEDEGLLEDGALARSLPSDCGTQLSDAASRVEGSIKELGNASASSVQQLSGALEHLLKEATAHSVDRKSCPVCATQKSDWFQTLEKTVEQSEELSALRKRVGVDTKKLAAVCGELLAEVISVGGLRGDDGPVQATCAKGKALIDAFALARETETDTQYSVLGATLELAEWLCSDEAKSLIDEAVKRADRNRQWRIARAQAVESFIAVWRADAASAAQSVRWNNASKRVTSLRDGLRKKRSFSLASKAGKRIEYLLSDADLRLKDIGVSSTKASMELVDQQDNAVDLGMLSAGQRNAVLLAPLLASVDAGPFGFLILDDPVHAFDELRIDRLAEMLSKLAETRRVVVLTHDDRLKEHLAARSIHCDTRLVDRENSTGAVGISDSTHFWSDLLADAGEINDLAIVETGSTLSVSDSMRRLCRLAIDNAIRVFTLRNAALSGRDTAADLKQLDSAYTTEDRLKAAESFWQGPGVVNPVSAALKKCEPHLEAWNQSIHGNPPKSAASRVEIKTAREVCKKLTSAK